MVIAYTRIPPSLIAAQEIPPNLTDLISTYILNSSVYMKLAPINSTSSSEAEHKQTFNKRFETKAPYRLSSK